MEWLPSSGPTNHRRRLYRRLASARLHALCTSGTVHHVLRGNSAGSHSHGRVWRYQSEGRRGGHSVSSAGRRAAESPLRGLRRRFGRAQPRDSDPFFSSSAAVGKAVRAPGYRNFTSACRSRKSKVKIWKLQLEWATFAAYLNGLLAGSCTNSRGISERRFIKGRETGDSRHGSAFWLGVRAVVQVIIFKARFPCARTMGGDGTKSVAGRRPGGLGRGGRIREPAPAAG
jgi:hypothetical protein